MLNENHITAEKRKEGEKMGRNGGCDFRELKEFQKKLEKFDQQQTQEFMESCAKELAARLLAKVIKRTPVRRPENCPPGVKGGTLRRGWTGGKLSSGASYAQSLNVTKVGSIYQIEIVNPVEYASYVEYGHRTRNHKGWVQGEFMLTIAESEIQQVAPKILENKLMKYLSTVFK